MAHLLYIKKLTFLNPLYFFHHCKTCIQFWNILQFPTIFIIELTIFPITKLKKWNYFHFYIGKKWKDFFSCFEIKSFRKHTILLALYSFCYNMLQFSLVRRIIYKVAIQQKKNSFAKCVNFSIKWFSKTRKK